MRCVYCGRELPDNAIFCASCGARQTMPKPEQPTVVVPPSAPNPEQPTLVVPTSVPEPEPTQNPHSEPMITPTPTPKKPKAALIAVAVLAALAIVGGGIYFVHASNRANAYADACSLYNAGRYTEAAEAFAELGDYEDAATLSQRANQWQTAQAAEAAAGEDAAAWEEVASLYDMIDEPAAAAAAENCRLTATYYTGTSLMSQGKWGEAGEVFAGLAAEDFRDATDLQLACDTHVTYEEAEALLADGHNYDAYVLFTSLAGRSYDDMPDFGERAQACVQDFPAAGVVYSNPNYSSTAVPLTINSNGSYTYYKIYMGDELVKTVLIHPSDPVTIELPAGTYRMNRANGNQWFGTDDMFGDEGSYYTCLFGGSKTFDLEYGYSYQISSSVGGTGGTGVGTAPVDRESF